MPVYETIGDHEQRMLARIRSQHRYAPRLAALARAFGAAVQEMEDALSALDGVLYLYATGARLDIYGAWVGEGRGSFDDDIYQRLIDARILANACKGSEDELWLILSTLAPTAETDETSLAARYPASIYAQVRTDDDPGVAYVRRVGAIMRLAKPAGVSFSGAWAVNTAYGFLGNPAVLGVSQGQLAYGL